MNLVQQSRFLSIEEFESPSELPPFVVLTGKNGSGKSHLLQAIKNNSIYVADSSSVVQPQNIILVEFGALSVAGGDVYTSQMAHQACDQVWQQFVSWRQSYLNEIPAGQIDFFSYIQRWRNVADRNMENIFQAVKQTLEAESGLSISRITKRHFWKNIFDPETSSSGVEFFEQNFAKLFAEYQVSLVKQRFYRFMNNLGYEDAPEVSEESIQAIEGNKPWDFVNEVLRGAKFDFEVLPPDFWDTEEFEYKIALRKLSSGAEITFGELSTGERVLFALALVRYKAEKRSNSFPELILLDEPDAPLHPAMTESMLDVFQSIFVNKYNTKVIITTHSPATVALAPEDSVYAVRASGNPNKVTINPVGKDEALDLLASGFIAISNETNEARVSFQVSASRKPILFCEGDTDKIILEIAWKNLYPAETQPFKVIACGNYSQICRKIDDVTVDEYSDNNLVAVMDFDVAFDAFNGLNRGFGVIKGNEANCLYRVRPNNGKKITAILLPVPAHRNTYANKAIGGKSKLSIELMFTDEVLSQNGNLKPELLPGGGSVNIFGGDKVRFASKTIAKINAAEFNHFKPLLERIRKALV